MGGGRDADTGPRPDTGPHDGGGGGSDAPDAWHPNDASTICGTMNCAGFTHCVSGACVAYPMCRGDGTCPTAGDVCTSLRCVPGSVDIDGDGSPASLDCDETDPTRSPLAHETCNNRDDNCNMLIDDGDPTALCAMNPAHGICMAGGMCGCPAGTADVDLTVPGCECTVRPAATVGTMCTSAIDMGQVFDQASGGAQTLMAMGNALPTREVWYQFHAVDVPDTSCDTFHVHVQLTVNPGNQYQMEVLRGACTAGVSCGAEAGAGENMTVYEFGTNQMTTDQTSECPCSTAPTGPVNLCSDNGGDYFVRIRRDTTVTATCAMYTLVVTNGL